MHKLCANHVFVSVYNYGVTVDNVSIYTQATIFYTHFVRFLTVCAQATHSTCSQLLSVVLSVNNKLSTASTHPTTAPTTFKDYLILIERPVV